MTSSDLSFEAILEFKSRIRALSEFNATNARDIRLHFQALKSARAPRLMMDAPGLYYRDMGIYVISKSGAQRGHASLNKSIQELFPEDKRTVYGFVLYPESYVRSCLDRLLRRSVRKVAADMRVSMENVFNKKYHNRDLTDTDIEHELIGYLQKDLGELKKKQ